MLAFRFGFWNEWLNPQKCTFDGENRRIYVNQGVTEIDVKVDVYSDWKEWASYLENSHWTEAIEAVGGQSITTGELGSTFFLLNNWKIVPWEGDYQLNVDGNLYTEDGSNPFVSVSGVSIVSTVSALNYAVYPPEGVCSSVETIASTLDNEVKFLKKIVNNKREIQPFGGSWVLFVYDDDGVTPILTKILKDYQGGNITNLVPGILAREEANSV